MKTCRHFRNRIPTEDADILRAADPEPCDVCDGLKSWAMGVTVEWDPIRTRRSPRLSLSPRNRMHAALQPLLQLHRSRVLEGCARLMRLHFRHAQVSSR